LKYNEYVSIVNGNLQPELLEHGIAHINAIAGLIRLISQSRRLKPAIAKA